MSISDIGSSDRTDFMRLRCVGRAWSPGVGIDDQHPHTTRVRVATKEHDLNCLERKDTKRKSDPPQIGISGKNRLRPVSRV